MEIRELLTAIDPSKECLDFLATRIESDNYRGKQVSQHNRYDVGFIYVMLNEFYKLAGTDAMHIRTTDLSKRPSNTPEEALYAHYVNNINSILKRCTQDSVRKNFFVDLARMGFINRFDASFNYIYPYDHKAVVYVALSRIGIDFLENADNIFQKNLLYAQAIDRLTKGLAEELLDVVSITGSMTIDDYQFFISFTDCNIDSKTYTRSEMINYMNEFESMSHFQREEVRRVVEFYCDPSTFSGDKTCKRDYHNWRNEAQQTFMLMDQTIYFEERGDALIIRLGENSLYEDTGRLNRSGKQKELYFENHNIRRKTLGFELHHVVPLLSARNRIEFDALDVWQNMIYIDGYTHSVISQTNNKNIELDFDGDDINLIDTTGIRDDIVCKRPENVIYALNLKDTMKGFNSTVLSSF